MDYRDRIAELLASAEEIGNGLEQLALTEEAVHLADSHQDVDAGFEARQEYVKATMFNGHPDRMLVAFSWCLSQFDTHPERFDLYRLLWQYKWVVNALPDFPQIERRQMDEMFGDMERRFERFGSNKQAVWNKRRSVAMKMGDVPGAQGAHQAMADLPRDELSDCHACEMDEAVRYHVFLDDDRRAIERAGPILRGRFTCSEVPQVTFAQVLIPLLRLGRGEDAMAYHLRGFRMIARNPAEFIVQLAEHVRFLTLTGNFPRGLRVIEKHLDLALVTCCPAWTFEVFLAAKLLMERLGEVGMISIRLRMPPRFPALSESGEYTVEGLRDWFTARAEELAGQFDRRNGNDFHRRRLNESEQLKPFAQTIKVPTRSPEE